MAEKNVYKDTTVYTECTVCLKPKKETEKYTILRPCGHSGYCNECLIKIEECPRCRQDISKKNTTSKTQFLNDNPQATYYEPMYFTYETYHVETYSTYHAGTSSHAVANDGPSFGITISKEYDLIPFGRTVDMILTRNADMQQSQPQRTIYLTSKSSIIGNTKKDTTKEVPADTCHLA